MITGVHSQLDEGWGKVKTTFDVIVGEKGNAAANITSMDTVNVIQNTTVGNRRDLAVLVIS